MTRLAEAYEALAEAAATLALEIRAVTPPDGLSASLPGGPSPSAPSFEELPFDDEDGPIKPQGSATMCPAHKTEYRDGRYGPFCAQKSEDPLWSKEGRDGVRWCSITPKNAAAYLRQKAQR